MSELLDMVEANPDINIGENILEESENVTVSFSEKYLLSYLYLAEIRSFLPVVELVRCRNICMIHMLIMFS